MAGKLFRYAASIIFATREGYHYPTSGCLNNNLISKGSSQRQKLLQLFPYVVQRKLGHVRGIEVLLVQRTTEAGFMPDSHVFPGGVLDKADCSKEWLELFPADTKPTMTDEASTNRLSLYSNVPSDSIIGELAFRICAIREAFEETGILLARPVNASSQSCHYQSLQSTIDQWRDKVCTDANNFLQLFREIKCVPDVWSLVEWSNWLTPENIPRRYDTVFYLCCLEGKPSPIHNPSEVSKAEWLPTDEALRDHQHQHITLPPPQVAELSVIDLFPSLQHLHLYALYKAKHDSRSCLLPRRILITFTSGEEAMIYSPLPGDDLYPIETTLNKYQCSSKALQHIVTLTTADNPLYEFTATAPSKSDVVNKKMIRMLFEDLPHASYVDTVRMDEINNIIGDINVIMNSKL